MRNAAFSKKTRERVERLEPGEFNALSVELAKVCVEAGISPTNVAKLTGVTRAAVHRWMHGSLIKESRRPRVRKLVNVFKEDLRNGVLPKSDPSKRNEYVERLNEML